MHTEPIIANSGAASRQGSRVFPSPRRRGRTSVATTMFRTVTRSHHPIHFSPTLTPFPSPVSRRNVTRHGSERADTSAFPPTPLPPPVLRRPAEIASNRGRRHVLRPTAASTARLGEGGGTAGVPRSADAFLIWRRRPVDGAPTAPIAPIASVPYADKMHAPSIAGRSENRSGLPKKKKNK